jgi:DNA-binding transcriptional ArsR family regulator
MVRTLAHPDGGSVTVARILYALADPVRLRIVDELLRSGSGLSCIEASHRLGQSMAKSTCSQHYRILRESGLIHCRREGTQLISRVRTELLEARFPGLLDSILIAHRAQARRKRN